MSNYYVLRSVPSISLKTVKGYMEIEDWDDGVEIFEDWGSGTPAKGQPTGPIELRAVPHDGYSGSPDDFHDSNVPLMSKRLKEAIESAGVDNINFYPVTVRNTETGETYEYFAFNLIGLMSVIDYGKSDVSSHDGDFIGDSQIRTLAIDESKTRLALMFRLKEKFSVILIHRVVKEAIEHSGINTVNFVAPKDFMAL